MWTEEDDEEVEYGEWIVCDAETSLAEQNKVHPPEQMQELWPHWNDGVPRTFRRKLGSPSFHKGTVRHRYREYYVTIELDWNTPHSLPLLRNNYDLLPSTFTRHWSGVYRIFSPDTKIDRCCGQDPTGTLYIGQAGSRGGWSILRTRIMAIVKGDHHATNKRSVNSVVREMFPWGSLAVEWAYTGERTNYKGETVAEAILAEGFLLSCYKQSYGELPPWNARG